MNNAYIKEQLKHVYWLCGGACAGKTTLSHRLVSEKGFIRVQDDVLKYRAFTTPEAYPALQMPNPTLKWEEWFNRAPNVHGQWMLDISREIVDFLLVDLLALPKDRPIVVDLGVEIQWVLPFIPKENIIGLFTDNETIYKQYLYRPDHKMILDCIWANTSSPEETAKNVSKSVAWFSNRVEASCREHGIKQLWRDADLTKDEHFRQVCAYFNL